MKAPATNREPQPSQHPNRRREQLLVGGKQERTRRGIRGENGDTANDGEGTMMDRGPREMLIMSLGLLRNVFLSFYFISVLYKQKTSVRYQPPLYYK